MTSLSSDTSYDEILLVPPKTWRPERVPPNFQTPSDLKEMALADAVFYASCGEPVHLRAPDGSLVHIRDIDKSFDVMKAILSQEMLEVWFPGVSRALGEDDPLVPAWIIRQPREDVDVFRNLRAPPVTPSDPPRVPDDFGWSTDLSEISYEEFDANEAKLDWCDAFLRMPDGRLILQKHLPTDKMEYSKIWLNQPRVEAWIPVWQGTEVCMKPHSVLTISPQSREILQSWSIGSQSSAPCQE